MLYSFASITLSRVCFLSMPVLLIFGQKSDGYVHNKDFLEIKDLSTDEEDPKYLPLLWCALSAF